MTPAYKALFVKVWCQEREKCKFSRTNYGTLEEFISSCLLFLSEKLIYISTIFPTIFPFVTVLSTTAHHWPQVMLEWLDDKKNVWCLRGELCRGFTILATLYEEKLLRTPVHRYTWIWRSVHTYGVARASSDRRAWGAPCCVGSRSSSWHGTFFAPSHEPFAIFALGSWM